MFRRPIRLVIPRTGRFPVIPDEIFALGAALHARFHELESLRRPLPVNRLLGHVKQGQHPGGDEIFLVIRIGEARGFSVFLAG